MANTSAFSFGNLGAGNAWFDQLQMGSFRGVEFHVDSSEITEGDNTVRREYPFQDLPTVFSMGAGAEEIKLPLYVIGDDYLDKLNALRAVLKGEGQLIHPLHGAIQVWVDGRYTIKEDYINEGGIARLNVTFVRAEERRYPVGVTNTADAAIDAALGLDLSAIANFASKFSIKGLAGWAGDLLGFNVLKAYNDIFNVVSDVLGVFENLKSTWTGLSDGSILTSLLSDPMSLATRFQDLLSVPRYIDELSDEVDEDVAKQLMSTYQSLFDIDTTPVITDAHYLPESPYVTPTRLAIHEMTTRCNVFIQTIALSAYVKAALQVDLDNFDNAMTIRQTIRKQCDKLMHAYGDLPHTSRQGIDGYNIHDALQQLKSTALTDLIKRSKGMAQLMSYTPTATTNILSLSYKLYGTAVYADEIMAMNNHIVHAMLVPAGIPLRIVKHEEI